MRIESGDDVYVDDGQGVVGHVRRVTKNEIVVFVEDQGDFTVPYDAVKTAANGAVLLMCHKLPLKVRAMVGHLHGEDVEPEDD